MKILATELLAEDFAPFGRVHVMASALPDETGAGLIAAEGNGWSDVYTAKPLISTNGSLGLTRGGGTPFTTHRMERHLATEEALFTAGAPLVLAVAEPTDAGYPSAADVRAFVISPGTVVVLHNGTWHDACHGVEGAAYYYWMAATGGDGGPTWTDIKHGPVHVSVSKARSGSHDG